MRFEHLAVCLIAVTVAGCAAEAVSTETEGTATSAVTAGPASDLDPAVIKLKDPTFTGLEFDRGDLLLTSEGILPGRDVQNEGKVLVPRLERSTSSLRPADGTPQDAAEAWSE